MDVVNMEGGVDGGHGSGGDGNTLPLLAEELMGNIRTLGCGNA